MAAFTSSTSTSAGLADGDCWFAKPTKKATLPMLVPAVVAADAPVRVLASATVATAVWTHDHAASALTLRADAIAANLGLCKENPVVQTSFIAQALAVNSSLVLFAAFAHFLPFEQACVSIKLVFDYAVANNLTDVANIAYSILPRSDATEEEVEERDNFWDFVLAHGVVVVSGPIEQIELKDLEKNTPLAVQDIMRFIRTEGPILFQHTPAPVVATAAVAEPIPGDVQTARSAFTDAAFVAEMDAALEDDLARLIAGDEDEHEDEGPIRQPRSIVHESKSTRHSAILQPAPVVVVAAGFEVVVEEAADTIQIVESFSRSPKPVDVAKSPETRSTCPCTSDLARPSLKSVTSPSSVMVHSASSDSLDSFPECAGALAFMDFTSPAAPSPSSSFATSCLAMSSSISNSDSVSTLATTVSKSPSSSASSDLTTLSSSASSAPSSVLVGSASCPSVAVYNKTKKAEKKSTSPKGTVNWISRVTSKARAAINLKRKPARAHQEEWVAPTGGFEWESMDDPFARA